MPDRRPHILARAHRAQKQGRAGDSIRLRILADELETMRWTGPAVVHTELRD